jgi:hypothetical protein
MYLDDIDGDNNTAFDNQFEFNAEEESDAI